MKRQSMVSISRYDIGKTEDFGRQVNVFLIPRTVKRIQKMSQRPQKPKTALPCLQTDWKNSFLLYAVSSGKIEHSCMCTMALHGSYLTALHTHKTNLHPANCFLSIFIAKQTSSSHQPANWLMPILTAEHTSGTQPRLRTTTI